MKITLLTTFCIVGMTTSIFADWAMRGAGELPINDTASWQGNPLTDNTNYRLGSIDGTIGTVSSADDFTLMGTPGNVFLIADVADSVGVVQMDGGTLNVAGSMRLGNNPTASATLNLSGGTLNIAKDFQVARFNSGVTGIVNMTGGNLNVDGAILVGNINNFDETAVFNYFGGRVNAIGQFQLQGTLNFRMGLPPIGCEQRTGAEGIINLKFPGDYSHIAGRTQWLIRSNLVFEVISLTTDDGPVEMTADTHGTEVTVNGWNFEIVWSDDFGGGIGVTPLLTEGSGGPADFWGMYPVQEGGYVDTGDWMGTLYVDTNPWVYLDALDAWLFFPVEPDADGGWMLLPSDISAFELAQSTEAMDWWFSHSAGVWFYLGDDTSNDDRLYVYAVRY